MKEIVVAIFPAEADARKAAEPLFEATPPDNLVVDGVALLVKDAEGQVSERKWTTRMPWKGPSGAIVGALIGFLGGPIGAAVGFTSGGLIGFARDASDTARAEDMLRRIHTELTPGKSALVVELAERFTQAFEAHARRLGGKVFHSEIGDGQGTGGDVSR